MGPEASPGNVDREKGSVVSTAFSFLMNAFHYHFEWTYSYRSSAVQCEQTKLETSRLDYMS